MYYQKFVNLLLAAIISHDEFVIYRANMYTYLDNKTPVMKDALICIMYMYVITYLLILIGTYLVCENCTFF